MKNEPPQYQPIPTIGQVPFVAGAIVVRNHMRTLRQRQKARRWQHFSTLFSRRPNRNLVTWRRPPSFAAALTAYRGAT